MTQIIDKVLELLVPPGKEKQRLDLFLTNQLPGITRARIKTLIDNDKVTVDGKTTKAGYLIRPGELIVVLFPAYEPTNVEPEDIPLNIIYEDDDLLVVNKPAGMVVHPAFANLRGTLVNALLSHCQKLSSVGGEKRPGLVHRLDKDTSGLLVVAKNDVSHLALSKQLSERKMEREYRAIVWGRLSKSSGRIAAALMRNPKDRLRMMIHPEGKQAVTHYQVLQELPLTSYLKLNLETGRTHQIRVHMASIGHPIFSDAVYGGRAKQLAGLNQNNTQFALKLLKDFPRQMLHAATIAFVHPATKELIRFSTPLPQDMEELLGILQKSSV
jgi:23S rRNA pseudouridine1911/1915/1917 synthase